MSPLRRCAVCVLLSHAFDGLNSLLKNFDFTCDGCVSREFARKLRTGSRHTEPWHSIFDGLLTWRPVQCPSAEQMHVQMIDGLTAVTSAIDDGAVAIRQAQLIGDLLGDQQQVS